MIHIVLQVALGVARDKTSDTCSATGWTGGSKGQNL